MVTLPYATGDEVRVFWVKCAIASRLQCMQTYRNFPVKLQHVLFLLLSHCMDAAMGTKLKGHGVFGHVKTHTTTR